MRALVLALTCFALIVALAGCGSGEGTGSDSTSEADARTAAQIRASAERRKQQSDEIARQEAIDRLNAENAPALEAEGPDDEQTVAKPAPRPGSGGALLSVADRESFQQLAAQLGGSSGIAVKRAGNGGDVVAAGDLRSGAAWSTMKTGVAAASIAAGTAQPALLTRAITASDNAAAEQLWGGLGAPDKAGALVGEQLRAAGDDNTQVQTQVVRQGFSAFGQTDWALSDQARFTAGLACTEPGKQILDLMGQVVPGQRWGLGSAGVPARFKGGWGPGDGGGYLVRQMGILTIQDRPIAVTIATLPADGSFDTGTRSLTQIAAWAASHINADQAPKAIRC